MTPEEFVKLLQDQKPSNEYRNNFYCQSEVDQREARIKSRNLLLYLKKMQELDPKVLLVGEAPGYKGCKLTGIPFTSEYQIRNNNFFKGEFEVLNTDNPEYENSAKIIWDTIGKTRQLPLMWNIYPFHPSTRNGRNGKPNVKDMDMGKDILEKLLTMFNIRAIYCVGRKSESALKNHELFRGYVRHPSHGGSKECMKSLDVILNIFTE